MIKSDPHTARRSSNYVDDLSEEFQRALGLSLSAGERELINQLERIRLSGEPPRVFVCNKGQYDFKQLLMRYLEWLDYDDNCAAVVAPSLAKAKALTPPQNARIFSAVNYDAIRSNAFTHLLILDASPRNYGEILRAAVSALPMSPDTYVIIHSSRELSVPPAFIRLQDVSAQSSVDDRASQGVEFETSDDDSVDVGRPNQVAPSVEAKNRDKAYCRPVVWLIAINPGKVIVPCCRSPDQNVVSACEGHGIRSPSDSVSGLKRRARHPAPRAPAISVSGLSPIISDSPAVAEAFCSA